MRIIFVSSQNGDTQMTLKSTLAQFKAAFDRGEGPFFANRKMIETQHTATQELISSGIEDRVIQLGHRAPVFALPTTTGALVRSDVLLARGPMVVSFFRGVWCPYCEMELAALEELLPEIEALGATLVGVSPQTCQNGQKSKRQSGVSFDILTDRHNALAKRFGLVHRLPDALIEQVHKPLGATLPDFNGDDTWELPIPARYVVAQNGMVTYASVRPDYTERAEPSEVLGPLNTLANAVARGALHSLERTSS